jgi:hypothetical protein
MKGYEYTRLIFIVAGDKAVSEVRDRLGSCGAGMPRLERGDGQVTRYSESLNLKQRDEWSNRRNMLLGERATGRGGDAAPGIGNQAAALITRLGDSRLDHLRFRDAINRLQNTGDDLVGITLGVRAAIFQIASVTVLDEVNRQAN